FRLDAELRLAQASADAAGGGGGGAAPAGRADGRTDQERIQGTWKIVRMVRQGKERAGDELKDDGGTMRFDGRAVTAGRAGHEDKHGTFALDPAKSPKQITITPSDEADGRKRLTGIYDLA